MSDTQAVEKFRAALNDPSYSHCSTREWFGGITYVYLTDKTSPSGVLMAASLYEAEARKILAEERKSPAYSGPQRGDFSNGGGS